MAQKRRGLGRGLQALIPEAQKEKVPTASRPSDVFFPDSRKDESRDEDAASQATHDAPEPEPAAEARSTRDLAATLLAKVHEEVVLCCHEADVVGGAEASDHEGDKGSVCRGGKAFA